MRGAAAAEDGSAEGAGEAEVQGYLFTEEQMRPPKDQSTAEDDVREVEVSGVEIREAHLVSADAGGRQEVESPRQVTSGNQRDQQEEEETSLPTPAVAETAVYTYPSLSLSTAA